MLEIGTPRRPNISIHAVKHAHQVYILIFHLWHHLRPVFPQPYKQRHKKLNSVFCRTVQLHIKKDSIPAYLNNSITLRSDCDGFCVRPTKDHTNDFVSLLVIHCRINFDRIQPDIHHTKALKCFWMDWVSLGRNSTLKTLLDNSLGNSLSVAAIIINYRVRQRWCKWILWMIFYIFYHYFNDD